MARRPRKPGVELGIKRQDTATFETKKIVDAPLKKRRLLHQSPSSPPCIHGDGVLPPGPRTPSFHHEDPSQRYRSNSLSQSQKTKSKTRLRNSNVSKLTKVDDFSGIELLATAACSSFLDDNTDHVKDEKVLKEVIVPNESDVTQNLQDNGNQKAAPSSKGLRLHWDLNTVMDDWEEPCDELLTGPHSQENSSEGVKSNLEGYESKFTEGVPEKCELIEESCSQEVTGTKTIASKTSDCESSGSKSDVADSSIQQPVSEEVMQCGSQSPKLCKSYCDNKLTSEDQPSECCGSNVTQDEKIEVGYDSPFEDGELREPKKETVSYESDNTCKDDLGTIENAFSEKVDHGQTTEDQSSSLVKEALPNNDTAHVAQVEESDCGSGKEASGRNRSPKNVTRNYSNIGTSYSRSWRDKVCFQDEHYRPKNVSRNYSPRDGYSYQNRRSSPSERNSGYDVHRVPNRYRFHDSYLERKVRCYSPKRRSRSRSRSGSPIAWNFQKRKNLDVTQSPDRVSPERSSKCYDEQKFTDGDFRDKRRSMIRRNQRFESIGYHERFKSDDHFRFTERSGRFLREDKHKENSGAIRKHDGHYENVRR
ncbi:hypothetical protein L2E82_31699 [Cichorium intybus]|uniref:Uncharacterized protein n=1 Tax=Cichorium intybus TaxID=13427 RepID=A0ACB9BE92_CICIN|nr:hypothetical protein L2E82_31699 [Cichorium intybus]